jgi:hypothetical protein
MRTLNSGNYVTTLDPLSVVDMEKLLVIKRTIKAVNDWNPKKKRVVIRGRKPAVKKIVHNFWTGKCSLRGYDWAGNVIGGIKNATMWDIYVYDRS